MSGMNTKPITNDSWRDLPNGYLETIQKGMEVAQKLDGSVTYGEGSKEEQIAKLKDEIESADAIVIGAGAGLSTSAGLTYGGERFSKYFFDLERNCGFHDMYTGRFYPFPDKESRWAFWSRNIFLNRYVDPPKDVYQDLLKAIQGKNYFVITTCKNHLFQKAGFDKKRLFYTQGDYGLFQSVNPEIQKTFDNEEWVMEAMEAQGFVKDADGIFQVPDEEKISMRLPAELIPKCPEDWSDVVMNLRRDDSFVEDEGWHLASAAYHDFLKSIEGQHVLFLELGIGVITPTVIKFPFWEKTLANENAVYACLNFGEAFCPSELQSQSICIDGDLAETVQAITA